MATSTEGNEEILKTEEYPCQETRLSNEKGAEDEQIEPPVIGVKKNDVIEDRMETKKNSLPNAVKRKPEEHLVVKEAEEQSSTEKLQKGEEQQGQALEVKESKVEVKNNEGLEAVSTEVEKLDSVVSDKVEETLEGHSGVTEKVEIVCTELVKPDSEVTKVEVKPEASPEDEIEDTMEGEYSEEKTCKEEEPSTSIYSEQVVSTNLEGEATKKEDEKSSPPGLSEKAEGLSKEARVVEEGVGEGNAKGSTLLDTMEHEKNEETVKDDTNIEGHTEKNLDEASVTLTANESQKSEVEVKDGKSLDTETAQDLPKEVLPTKSTQKQSNKLISKVKQSLVKAKKAIIGKSPSSKTLSSETKGEMKVK